MDINLEEMNELVKRDNDKRAQFHLACIEGRLEIINLLLLPKWYSASDGSVRAGFNCMVIEIPQYHRTWSSHQTPTHLYSEAKG